MAKQAATDQYRAPRPRLARGLTPWLLDRITAAGDWVSMGVLMNLTAKGDPPILPDAHCGHAYLRRVRQDVKGFSLSKHLEERLRAGRMILIYEALRLPIKNGTLEKDAGRGVARRFRITPPPVAAADRIIRIGKRTFTVLFPDLLRRMTHEERQALKNDIRKRGVVVPLVIDEADGIIDGINRAEIAAELAPRIYNVPTKVREGLSLEQKRDLCLSLNDARRHLSAADRKKVKELRKQRVAEKRHVEGKTLEAIAEEEGVSEGQVRKDLKEVEQEKAVSYQYETAGTPSPPAAPPPRVTGKDGKSYPARKPRKKKQVATPPALRPAPAGVAAHALPVVDQLRLAWAEHCAPIWAGAAPAERAAFLKEIAPHKEV